MPLISEKDFVVVEDKTTGKVWPDPIPKHWVGTDLAPNTKVSRKSPGDTDPTPVDAPAGAADSGS